jgi:hypothetical protein
MRHVPSTNAPSVDALGSFIWQASNRVHAAAGLREGTVVTCRLIGGSMQDAIPAHSQIRISFGRPVDRVGEVVAFMEGSRVVAHRVAYRSRLRRHDFLVTRGDARILPDPPVPVPAVLGTVDQVDDGSGWRALGAQSRLPRRDRCLAFVLLCASAMLLEASPSLARRFVAWLESTDMRIAWIKRLLY